MTDNYMKSEKYSSKDWLDRMYRKSESQRTRNVAETSLNMFEFFCKSQGVTSEQMIEKYQSWFNQQKPDIRSICLSLDRFVKFLDTDNENIHLKSLSGLKFKRKTSKTIRVYLGFVKNWLRICHSIKISSDDLSDYIQIPKALKQPREPVTLEQLKQIVNHASPLRRALYLVLISSGMRIGEALSITKDQIKMDEMPVSITLEASQTKSRSARQVFISSEAVEKLKPILDSKGKNEMVFTHLQSIGEAVSKEGQRFSRLRSNLGFNELYKNSIRHKISLHSFRAYFATKAGSKWGEQYSNAMIGHAMYLDQYHRLTKKEKADKYLELMPDLFIESQKLETEKVKEDTIKTLQENVEKLQEQMLRMRILENPTV